MEMINGEKKLHVWLYKYEQDGVSPVFEVDGSRQEVEYTINNSVDSLYTFCKLEFADDSSEECEVADIYTLEVPGDAGNPQMNLRVFTAENSPFIDVLVTNDQKGKIVEQNYLVGGLETVEVEHDEEQNVVSETLAELDKMPGMSQIKEKMKDIIECAQLQKLREEQGIPKVEISRHLVLQGPPDVWIIYLLYFVLITAVFLTRIPTVTVKQQVRIVECVMLGNGQVTNEIFNNTRYRGYSLLCETNDGRAYSSPNGEMLYTQKVRLSTEGGDTILSLLTYILFFSVVGIGICEIVQRLFSGALNITSTFNLLKQRMGSFNIFSESYPVRENLEGFWNVIVQIFVKR